MADDNPRAVSGGNFPPTPYDDARKAVDDVYAEAAMWLDGAVVDSQELADDIGNLITMIRAAEKLADDARTTEKAPFDRSIAEIQTRYAPLIANTKAMKGKTVIALEACKKALQPWLQKLADELEAKARIARDEADRKRRDAEAAIRKAAPENLMERATAEALIIGAKRAETVARKAESTTAKAGGTFGRATALRSVYTPTLVDARKAMTHYWATNKPEIMAFVEGLAQRDVRNGKREIPGFRIDETKTAV